MAGKGKSGRVKKVRINLSRSLAKKACYAKRVMVSPGLCSFSTPFIVSIEGNIGSGKSTLVHKLCKWLPHIEGRPVVTLQEPVSEWETFRDEHGETMLSKFYANQHKYAFPFQMMAYISRVASLRRALRANPGAIILTERSVETDRHVFAQMLRDEGKIEDVELQIYLRWFDEFIQDIPISATVYVNADAEVCDARIKKRCREGEVIPLEYLQRCGDYHNQWLSRSRGDLLELDANQTESPSVDLQWIQEIRSFVTGLMRPFPLATAI